MAKRSPDKRGDVRPLESRHVFLDTQAYRSLGHNPSNRALGLLKEQVVANKIALHTADITLLEIERQIREQVEARHRELTALEKSFRPWRNASNEFTPAEATNFNVEKLAKILFDKLSRFVRVDCSAELHKALEVNASTVFETYFKRKAPFDGPNSKEFPDAFVLETLRAWCAATDERIYIVTEDKAMLRVADEDDCFLPLSSIHDLLERASGDFGAEGENAADKALHSQAFDQSFETFLESQIKDITFVYMGDLPDGEAYDGELVSVLEISNWSVVALSDSRVSLILDLEITVGVQIQYEDRDLAFYDKEDNRWYGSEAASTNIAEDVSISALVDIDRSNGQVRDGKVLTGEISVYGPSWD